MNTVSSIFFTFSRERRLWLYAFLMVMTIFSTLFLGRPFLVLLSNQDIQAALFLGGMLLTGVVIVCYGIFTKPNKIDIILYVGIFTIYLLLFLRLGLPERSHLIEYSILTLCIHQILVERIKQGKTISYPLILTFVITFFIGLIDECLQFFIPDRVFDTNDIIFNGIVIFMAIGMSGLIQFFKKEK